MARSLLSKSAAALVSAALLLQAGAACSEPPRADGSAAAAGRIADFFGSVGDQIFEECIFELSAEQIAVQQALIQAYIAQGASSQLARQLAVKQIQPPKLSPKCEQIRRSPDKALPAWEPAPALPKNGHPEKAQPEAGRPEGGRPDTGRPESRRPEIAAIDPEVATGGPRQPPQPQPPSTPITLAGKQQLPLWDCAPDVDFVTIRHNGYDRKLSGGEICKPFQDVVREVPDVVASFRLGYTIRTGRLFVISDVAAINGRTITWGLSGRDICRNNPDPDCLATRAVGPLPPGQYAFAADKAQRVTWGPKTKRYVAAIYLSKLWNRERFSPRHTQAILSRGNIAIHMRLKGEMSEACIGLEPKSWGYVAGLIKSGRATSLDVFIDEPHPQLAEKPPVIAGSGFSLTSLFK